MYIGYSINCDQLTHRYQWYVCRIQINVLSDVIHSVIVIELCHKSAAVCQSNLYRGCGLGWIQGYCRSGCGTSGRGLWDNNFWSNSGMKKE